jgi:hypothetical protein
MLSVCRERARNVKGEMVLRWIAAGMLDSERVKCFRELRELKAALRLTLPARGRR